MNNTPVYYLIYDYNPELSYDLQLSNGIRLNNSIAMSILGMELENGHIVYSRIKHLLDIDMTRVPVIITKILTVDACKSYDSAVVPYIIYIDMDEDRHGEYYESGNMVNRCLECGIDMGESNPRQYCAKTYCENA